MVRSMPGTHRNPGRRPPGLRLDGGGSGAAQAQQQQQQQQQQVAPPPQQTSAEACKSEDGSAAAAVSGAAPPPLPLPHMPPNHHTRGKRPSGLVLPRDVHHSVDGTPLSALVKGDAAEATNAPARAETAAAAAAAGATAAAPPAGVRLAAGRLPPGEISFHTICAFATSVAKCKGAGCVERKRRRVVK